MRSVRRTMLSTLAAVLGAATLPLAATPAAAASEPLTVRIDSGLIKGKDTGAARVFSGIRYAAAPVGPLRWQAPQPVRLWTGVADATKPGPWCTQHPLPGVPELPISEDCLFLNVTTPREQTDKPRPVIVWMHGGGYTSGSGNAYDAQRMASQGDVVVVTINYRLGIFGYFGHPGLRGSGNFGLADQLAALHWVKRNARAFGGDPGNVTLAGQSAGAMSTCALLTSPATVGLVDKAIIDSGSCMVDWPEGVLYPSAPAQTPYAPVADTRALGAATAEQLGCTGPATIECLRGKPAAELLSHTTTFANHLSYHTPLLPTDPAQAMRAGRFLRIPVLSGGTRDEMRSFIGGVVLTSGPITPRRYQELLRNTFGEDAAEVGARYPLADYESPALAWATLTTDLAWSCPTLRGDQLLARHTRVYAYEFADRAAPNVNGIEVPDLPQGAAHATDLPYLFDLGGQDLLSTPRQHRLAEQMVRYWTAFAHTGDPNTAGTPYWPEFAENGTVLSLAPGQGGIRPADYRADHNCDFWAG